MPAGCVVVLQPFAPQTVTLATASAETWPPGSAHEIAVWSAVVPAKTGEVGVGGAGGSLSTVIVRVAAAVKLSPASTTPISAVCVPSPMFDVTTGRVTGAARSGHGLARV